MGIPANHPAILTAIEKGLITGSGGAGGGDEPKSRRWPTATSAAVVSLTVWITGLLPVSEANKHDGTKAKIGRKKAVKSAVSDVLESLSPPPSTRYRVKFVRVGGHKLDRDNLSRAYKAARDLVSKWLAVDDGDEGSEGRVRWSYAQRPNGFHGVVKYAPGTRIVITAEND